MKSRRIFTALLLSALAVVPARAQYYELANQMEQVMRPILSGSLNYKGSVDVAYSQGVGSRRADFLELTTTQGFQYASWFYMGVGLGVQTIMTDSNVDFDAWQNYGSWNQIDDHSQTGWMMPLFTDFRFNIGKMTEPSFFIDLKIGASFLLSDSYLEIGDGFLNSDQAFFFKPAIGLRIPLNQSGKQAVNVGFSYQLMSQNYLYRNTSDINLSSFGATIGFEW